MDTAVVMHLITVSSILSFKIVTLIVGYRLAKLGYDLLLRGITGQFQFKGDFRGIKADLVSASPGTLFIVLATALLIFAVVVDKPFSTSTRIATELQSMQQDRLKKSDLPPEPPVQPPDKKELQ